MNGKIKCFNYLTLIAVLIMVVMHAKGQDTAEFYNFLKQIPGIQIKKLNHAPFFTAKYEISIPQYIDHNDPDKGTFRQRIFISHKSQDKPVVFITEGYSAAYGKYPLANSELTSYLDANQIVSDHRYFGESVPEPLDWQYLTVENAAGDHHRIIELFKNYYQGKWISTGVSKGGQTAMFHRYFYPDDVDVTVGYVCPLNFSIEEPRVYTFLDHVGDSACRQKVVNFQYELLKNKQKYFPEFQKLALEKGLTYRMGELGGYELIVLEYSFAYWQYQIFHCDSIPGPDASAEKAIRHLDAVASLDWVSDSGIEGMQPFFYQALTEIGFYGYDLEDFDGLIEGLDNGLFTFTAPEGVECIYDPEPMQNVDAFVRHHADKMIFIYGEWDPWSAPAVQLTGREGVKKYVNPRGSHGSNIYTLPEDMRKDVFNTLEGWLDVEIK
jgi:hypothetical protein